MINDLDALIIKLINVCEKWIVTNDKNTFFIDPIEKKEITGHYGASHVSAAFIIYGEETGNKRIADKGYLMLNSLLERWEQVKESTDFHNDFNNFALCVIERYMEEKGLASISECIRKTVLNTEDSLHSTVNWLPMRAYVNCCRFLWTNKKYYKDKYHECLSEIKKATFEDGLIEDRLPKGLSFNLQYNIATVAVLQFFKNINKNIEITKEFNALMSLISPDHDINYLGRGTNQIFAWGLWIYLLSSSSDKEYNNAIYYLENRLDIMLKNNNIMLNKWNGNEKYLWWDYHYCSVYTAHLLMWLVLAKKDRNKYKISRFENYELSDSGVDIEKNENFFVAKFNGRKEYLAEKGPVITNLWLDGLGCIIKGSFGPWRGSFGMKYSNNDVLNNFMGLIQVTYNKNFSNYRILRKFHIHTKDKEYIKLCPYFAPIDLVVEENIMYIKWVVKSEKDMFLNIPVLYQKKDFKNHIELFVDNMKIPLIDNAIIRNQYDWCMLLRSNTIKGNEWLLKITI